VTPKGQRVVFISYSHGDSDFVNSFAAALLKYDLQIWKDSKDLPIGGNILKSIYSGIKNSSHFCWIISASSLRSRWVEEEASFAKVRQLEDIDLKIIPVLIDEVEIPDYVRAYLCAHLENRDLSLANPEFLRVLKAFGTDLERYPREVITGKKREALRWACAKLLDDLAPLRETLGALEIANTGYQAALSNISYDPPPEYMFPELRSAHQGMDRPTTYGWEHRVDQARSAVLDVLTRLNGGASKVQASLEFVRRAWDDADPPPRTVPSLLARLHEPLDHLRYISGEASKESDPPEDAWWIRGKLSGWLEQVSVASASINSAIALLDSWASFDPRESDQSGA